eukprot:450753-Lingulodinium_polyedra.AAC.1
MPYFPHPPVRAADGEEIFLCSRAAPMGFGASAGWAQAVTDTVVASLPASAQLRPQRVRPP